mmetsp:Transcript_24682/g.27344  ORF Transcript_24682/g.27344 Transcript_24682/m.27344 type:complete len:95 (-) Transcript_24682:9-293(-)
MYKNKKKTRLTQLIIDLKKKALEEEEEDKKEQKRERYKMELAEIVLENIKEPTHDTKMAKFMELKMLNYITILKDQIEILKRFNRKVMKSGESL